MDCFITEIAYSATNQNRKHMTSSACLVSDACLQEAQSARGIPLKYIALLNIEGSHPKRTTCTTSGYLEFQVLFVTMATPCMGAREKNQVKARSLS